MPKFPEMITFRAHAGTAAAVHLAASRGGMNSQKLMRDAIRSAVEAHGVTIGQSRERPATGDCPAKHAEARYGL